MGKRVLLIADTDGLWTRRVVENVLLPGGMEPVIFPIWERRGDNDAFYQAHGVPVYQDKHRLPIIRHIPRLRMWARLWLNARSLMRQYGPFELVANHYLSQRDLALGGLVARKYHARWVCCFWGSDLLRAPEKELKRMEPYLQRCDCIHSVYNLIQQRMMELYGPAVAQKTHLLQFGHPTFDCIDQIRTEHDKAACKAHFGIGADRFVLCVGYSASSAQQQMKVLRALATLPEEKLCRMTIVLQQTYCMDDAAYVEQTRAFCRSLPCETVVLTEFMSDRECAWLRLAADAFILAITTDAFSASLREYLYAGARVMYGSWLAYPQFAEMGMDVPTFDAFDDLPSLLEQAMDGPWPRMTEEQRAAFLRQYSAKGQLPKWLALYQPEEEKP